MRVYCVKSRFLTLENLFKPLLLSQSLSTNLSFLFRDSQQSKTSWSIAPLRKFALLIHVYSHLLISRKSTAAMNVLFRTF